MEFFILLFILIIVSGIGIAILAISFAKLLKETEELSRPQKTKDRRKNE